MAASRRGIVVFAVLLALPIAAFLLLRWVLEPERLGALLLERAAAATGLNLEVTQPAALGVWPQLQLELVGLSARDGESLLLSAERIDVALPLSVLWTGDAADVGELHLSAPRVDVDALTAWWQQRPAADGGTLQLPGHAFELSIERGAIAAADWRLASLEMSASPLVSAMPFEVRIDGQLQSGSAAPLPLRLTLQATPRIDDSAIVFYPLQLVVGSQQAAAAVSGDGSARIASIDQLDFELQLQLAAEWPADWPALPAAAASLLPGRTFRINLTPGADGASRLSIVCDDPELVMSMSADPADLLDWWQAGDLQSLPPLTGTLDLQRWSHGAIGIEGLQVELRDTPRQDADVEVEELP